MKKNILISLLLLQTLHAQTLKESIGNILTTNPLIQEKLKNYELTKNDIAIAKSDYFPKLNLNLGAGYENTDNTTGKTKFSVYQNSLVYSHNLFRGFNTKYKVEEQELRTLSAAYSYVETVNTTAFDMANTYIELLKNKELLTTSQKNVDIDQEILTKVKKLYNSGLTTLSEVNKIESSLALAKANLVVQENTLLDASFNLQKVYGSEIALEELQQPELLYTFPETKEEALEFALNNNPSLLVTNFNIKQSQAVQHANRSSYYPTLDVEISQNMNKNLSGVEGTDDQFRAMAYLKYNLFNGFSDRANIQKSQKQIAQELEKQNSIKREITQKLNLSWTSKIKLEEQLIYLVEYQDFSAKTLKLYTKEYDLGRRSLLDLLSAQNDYIRAQSQIITTQYNILLAKYRILNAMGILVPAIIDDKSLIYTQVNLEDRS